MAKFGAKGRNNNPQTRAMERRFHALRLIDPSAVGDAMARVGRPITLTHPNLQLPGAEAITLLPEIWDMSRAIVSCWRM